MKNVKIDLPDQFSFKECLWFLDRGYTESTHSVIDNAVYKYCEIDQNPVLLHISADANCLQIGYLANDQIQESKIIDYVNDWFDLKVDLNPFYTILKKDKDLNAFLNQYWGLRLISIPDFFETIIWSIIGQQINLTFAFKMKKALVERFGEKIHYNGMDFYKFPSAKILLNISEEAYKEMQFSKQKTIYVKIIAEAFAKGVLHKDLILNEQHDKQNLLTQFKGIGEWTAQYVLMKHFRIGNAIPYGDSGINQALFNLKGIPKKNARAMQEAFFKPYQNHSAYLVFYLWRSLSKINDTQ